MPIVGNDVVDLKEPANSGKSRDSRFLKKILTDAEIEYVKNAGNPDLALWSLWACKETAYKVIKKCSPDIVFIPRRWQTLFNIRPSEHSEGEVRILESGGVSFRLFSNSDFVHCIGAKDSKTLDLFQWGVELLPKDSENNPSHLLRSLLVHRLAEYYSLDCDRIKINRDRVDGELQPPFVYIGGKKTDIDVSLSHDGRFVAYVFS